MAVWLLSVVACLNVIDRSLPAILAELIKRDLALSDAAIGLINGFGFLVVYAVAAIPVSRLADRRGYGPVIGICMALWSVMTALGGFAQSGWQLAMSRLGVALGEAGATPCSQAFIASRFPPERRAAPIAALNISIPVSTLIAMVAGGYLGQGIGWRSTMMVLGVISLVFAPLVFLALGRSADAGLGPPRPVLGEVAQLLRGRSYRTIVIGSAVMGIAAFGHLTFAVAFLMRFHGYSVAEVGVSYGVTASLAGGVAILLTGWGVDRLARRDPRWVLWIISLTVLCLSPFSVASYLVADRAAAIYLLAVTNCIAVAYTVPVVAAVQWLAPSHLRATSSALNLFSTAILGGIGPLVVGMISDALTPHLGAAALGRALLVVPAAYLAAGAIFWWASRSFLAEVESAMRESDCSQWEEKRP
jgi:predicted MFS family arabinose efflux permease